MRYRPAIKRPGRNLPSLSKAADELEGRDPEPELLPGERGGVAGAKSSVAPSPSPVAGVPHDEQNRPARGISVPQAVQVGMIFSRYSLPRFGEIYFRT